MSKININQNEVFGTKHSRDYYRGTSFHFSGNWDQGVHYISDDYNIDFVVHDQVLLACAKSHLSTLENEPKEYIYNEDGMIIGVISRDWDFVLSGIKGNSCAVRIIDNYWYVCENANAAPEHQIWINTGVKAKMELSDLTPEEIALLQEPGLQVVTDFVNNTMTQTTGMRPDKIMSQKATTVALESCASKTDLNVAIAEAKTLADETYQPKGDYATNTTVNAYKQDADAKNLAVNARVDQTNLNVAQNTNDIAAEVEARTSDVNVLDQKIDGVSDTLTNALNDKVDKVNGKGLSTNDYTDADQTKLNSVESNAQANVIESVKRNGSAITIINKSVDVSVPTKVSDITNDTGFVTATVSDNMLILQ